MNLAIFDLDNTLLDGDSDYNWGLYLVKKGYLDEGEYKEQNQILSSYYTRLTTLPQVQILKDKSL